MVVENSQTLSQRLVDGEMPVAEALRLARELADILRRMHDEGRTQGVLTPDLVVVTPTGMELLAAPEGAVAEPSPYAAPELSQGHPPDACTDVFTFGAIVHHMLTGRAPDGGSTRLLDEPGLDRLLSTCLAPDRSARWQRMHQVVTALRLLAASARRAESGGVTPYNQLVDLLCAEIARLEKTQAEDLEEQGQAMAARLSEEQTAVNDRISGADSAVAAAATEIRALKETVKAQAAAIESARAATARTDELVEGVVDALESLQSLLLDRLEERQAAAHA